MKLFCAFLLISGSCQQSLVILPRFVQHKAYLHLYFHMAFLPVFALLLQVYWWLDWDSTLIQHDLILINIQRYYFQMMLYSQVPRDRKPRSRLRDIIHPERCQGRLHTTSPKLLCIVWCFVSETLRNFTSEAIIRLLSLSGPFSHLSRVGLCVPSPGHKRKEIADKYAQMSSKVMLCSLQALDLALSTQRSLWGVSLKINQ